MSQSDASQPPPQHPRAMSAYSPPTLRILTGAVELPLVVFPVQEKKVMPNANPDTKEQNTFSDADTSASSKIPTLHFLMHLPL